MNTDKLMELERKWRGMNCRTEAQDRVYRVCADQLAALRAEQAVGDEQRARELAEIATWHRRMHLELSGKGSEWAAKEMYACQHGKFAETLERALGTARQPENIGEFVIALLIAGGYVTQAKVDEARNIALGHGPYEMPARQSEGVTREAWAILRPDGVTIHPESVRGDEGASKWSIGEWNEMSAKGFRCIPVVIAAAPGGEGEG